MRCLVGTLVALLLWYTPVQAETPEYQVKAAMLANFALFVEWPPTAFSSARSPFAVCVLGKDPFGSWLKTELGQTPIGSHPVEIRHLEKAAEARQCHLVFISSSEQSRLKQVLASLADSKALIVSDVSDISAFCREGGIIGLLMEGKKVRFEVNANAAARVGLKIDSKLKRLALTTKCGGGP